jgi:hypothetical protein
MLRATCSTAQSTTRWAHTRVHFAATLTRVQGRLGREPEVAKCVCQYAAGGRYVWLASEIVLCVVFCSSGALLFFG